ncbi:MAG: hypothetical protein M3Q16_01245 [Pseudomonadota bacterium]|nr:hypothetical protein [Pseudomonadota bacterium]
MLKIYSGQSVPQPPLPFLGSSSKSCRNIKNGRDGISKHADFNLLERASQMESLSLDHGIAVTIIKMAKPNYKYPPQGRKTMGM